MTNPNTHIDELNKVIQAMTNPNAHKMNKQGNTSNDKPQYTIHI